MAKRLTKSKKMIGVKICGCGSGKKALECCMK